MSTVADCPNEVGRQRAVEVIRNGERAGGQSKWPGRRMGRGNWPEFCDGAASADDDDVLPCLHSVE